MKLSPVSSIQVSDQTFIAAAPERIAAAVARRDRWRIWWPDLALTVREDRGEKGIYYPIFLRSNIPQKCSNLHPSKTIVFRRN